MNERAQPAEVSGLRARVRETGLLPRPTATGDAPRAAVLVLCSGGRDSLCLLDVAAALCGPEAIHVLHVDHGLRDTEPDAELVRSLAAELGVAAVEIQHAGPSPASGNLHAWARDRRRALAAQAVARLRDAGVAEVIVATAHTRTDLVETALGRLASQPGRRALLGPGARGVLPGDEGTSQEPAALVRPLLELTREQTGDYCRARTLRWADDPSNADRRFARARLRHEVLPVLRTLNPQAEAAIARTLGELREESEALDAVVAAELGHASGVSRTRLAELPAAVARLVLRELCERAAGRPVPQVTSRLADVLALGDRGELDVGSGARVRVAGGVVSCVASQGPAAPHP